MDKFKHPTTHPLSANFTYKNVSSAHKIFYTNIIEHTEPQTYSEAISSPQWKAAITDELQALEANKTWDLVPFTSDIHPIGCRYVFKLKLNPDGTVDKYNARLVAKGYTQQFGLDYNETFSPVAKLTSVRVLLALASMHDWSIDHLDVHNAFLNGELTETIYMYPPRTWILA